MLEDPLGKLSKREQVIARKFAEGLTYRQISETLFVAPSTVRSHIASIYRKLDVNKKSALTILLASSQSQLIKNDSSESPSGIEMLNALSFNATGRRQITILYARLCGVWELSIAVDPEELVSVIAGIDRSLRQTVDRYGGHTRGLVSDGLRVFFGYPSANENDPERAVRCGLELISIMTNDESELGHGLSWAIGVATGAVAIEESAEEQSDPEKIIVGTPPHTANRLQRLALPGQLLVADATMVLLGDLFESYSTKDTDLIHHHVSGPKDLETRFDGRPGGSLLPMVGRDQELASLLEIWTDVREGYGEGVLLLGEAGIGKSRVTQALMDSIVDESHHLIRFQCSPLHSDSALWPIIQQLVRMGSFGEDDDRHAKLDKLEQLITDKKSVPMIAELLGLEYAFRYGANSLSLQVKRARTFDILINYFRSVSISKPSLFIIEDLHWIDPTTFELTELLLDSIQDNPILLVMTSRPNESECLISHPNLSRLTLNRLSRNGVRKLIGHLGGGSLPPETTKAIITRTDGIPLFVEEVMKALLESGDETIPATLRDSLMARLDRLPEAKNIAQIASCIGRDFKLSLLSAVAGRSDKQLAGGLDVSHSG